MIMNSVEYLQKELKIIADKFPRVNIRYGFNDTIKTHIVELLPLFEYNTNEDLDNAWIPLSISFLENYMDEEIAFISSDSSLSIKNILFQFNSSACTEENIITHIYDKLTSTPVVYNFPTEMQDGFIMKDNGIDLMNKPVEKLGEENNYSYLYADAA